jgi:COP9 signalosome complex subunit 1
MATNYDRAIESAITNYNGSTTKVQRLLFIFNTCLRKLSNDSSTPSSSDLTTTTTTTTTIKSASNEKTTTSMTEEEEERTLIKASYEAITKAIEISSDIEQARDFNLLEFLVKNKRELFLSIVGDDIDSMMINSKEDDEDEKNSKNNINNNNNNNNKSSSFFTYTNNNLSTTLPILNFKKTETKRQKEFIKQLIEDRGGEEKCFMNAERAEEIVGQMRRENQKEKKRLDEGLTMSKASQLKEGIRLAHNDLGDYFYNCGDLKEAFASYAKSREYGTRVKHTLAMCMNSIRCALELNENTKPQVLLYANKGIAIMKNYQAMTQGEVNNNNNNNNDDGHGQSAEEIVMTQAKFTCAAGLAHLFFGKFLETAKHFTSLNTEIGNAYAEVISQQDVVIYGSLCALATFDREQLKKHVVHENVYFRDALGTVPEMRAIVEDFWNSRYPQCLSKLEQIKPELELDIYLAKHVDALYELIRQRALIQYTKPFSALSLKTMSIAFDSDLLKLEKELAKLITANKINARIDSGEKILSAKVSDKRVDTFRKVQKTADMFVESASEALLRSSLNRFDLAL